METSNISVFDNTSDTTVSLDFEKFPAVGHDIIGGLLVITMLVGICTNSFGILIFVKHKHLRSPTNLFIASLALCDLLMLVTATPLPMASSFAHRWVWGYAGCVFEGFLVYFLGLTSLYLLCAISVDRYIVIALPLKNAMVNQRVAKFSIMGCYVLGFFWAMLPLLGWNSYQLEGLMTSCSVLWDTSNPKDYSYNVVIFFTCFVFPVIVMCYCYYQVYRTVRVISRNNKWDSSSRMAKRKMKAERKISITILMMIGVYFGSWMPYAVVSFWAAFGNASDIPLVVAGIPPYVAKTASVWNPIIYICTNKQFRKAFFDILPCDIGWRNSVQSTEMVNVASARVGAIVNPEVTLCKQSECPDVSNPTRESNMYSGDGKKCTDDGIEEILVE
ncbi:visual pigment-like receptor peropsin [Pecten maximus]|uniref:visual pigment-like receptor peropsin n=1 Tax=Pecten maximus TaxID=6579 RepID=UPI0014580E5B|nr:visual pigment-like receptor peropsin [Pecten maximus]